jgi:glc operon protein GlcG
MKRFASFAAVFALVAAARMAGGAEVGEKKFLTIEGAKKAAAAAAANAKRRGLPVVIVVVDDGGELLYFERLDGTQTGSIKVGIGKARTAAQFKRPTRFFEEQIRNGRIVTVALPDFTPLQGGVPIFSAGQFVGAIGVSGDSPQVDEEIATAGATAVGETSR